MAVIYEFRKYYATSVLREHSHNAGCVALKIHEFNAQIEKLNTSVARVQRTLQGFATQLETRRHKLNKSQAFARKCSAAWNLKSVEKMIEVRNKIARSRRSKFK